MPGVAATLASMRHAWTSTSEPGVMHCERCTLHRRGDVSKGEKVRYWTDDPRDFWSTAGDCRPRVQLDLVGLDVVSR